METLTSTDAIKIMLKNIYLWIILSARKEFFIIYQKKDINMLIMKKAKENSVSTGTAQQMSLESTVKTEPSLNFPTQKESNNIQKFH